MGSSLCSISSRGVTCGRSTVYWPVTPISLHYRRVCRQLTLKEEI